MKVEAQAAVAELLEESGLPPICLGIATKETRDMPLGELLAESLRMQRNRKNPKKQLWDQEGHVSKRLPNLDSLLNKEVGGQLLLCLFVYVS